MKVYLYVLDTLADWEVGYILAELNSGRFLRKPTLPLEIIKIGNTKKQITTMGGITIIPDESIENVKFNGGDLLILPGGDTWMCDANTRIITMVSELLNSKVIIAAICAATIALAKNGLLNKRNHTSNDLGYLKMVCPEYTGSDYYLNKPAVIDDNLITASGLAPFEFTYETLKKINVMNENTLEAWYQLYKTRESGWFMKLIDSLK
jgi:putative intracellular protease/amidase